MRPGRAGGRCWRPGPALLRGGTELGAPSGEGWGWRGSWRRGEAKVPAVPGCAGAAPTAGPPPGPGPCQGRPRGAAGSAVAVVALWQRPREPFAAEWLLPSGGGATPSLLDVNQERSMYSFMLYFYLFICIYFITPKRVGGRLSEVITCSAQIKPAADTSAGMLKGRDEGKRD